MTTNFFIKNNEQEFKDLFFRTIKKDEYAFIEDFNYQLITEKNEFEKHYLFFALDPNRTKIYTDTLYSVSNKFGEYVCKKRKSTWSKLYLMLIKDNYYFYYYFCNTPLEISEACGILYLNDVILRFDNDNLAWGTLTVKKVNELLPIEATYEIKRKLPMFIDAINSIKMLDNL